MYKILVVIQARMGSTRLPGKILMPLHGQPLLLCLIDSLKQSRYDCEFVVATSDKAENNRLENFLRENGIKCYRGSENDVLSRFTDIVCKFKPDIVVRATADDPLMSGECLDILIDELVKNHYDYVFMKNLPIGISPEVIRAKCFEKILEVQDLSPRDREHVTLYFKEHPELFRVKYVDAPVEYRHPEMSFTVDTEEDYKKMERLYGQYGKDISLRRVLRGIYGW